MSLCCELQPRNCSFMLLCYLSSDCFSIIRCTAGVGLLEQEGKMLTPEVEKMLNCTLPGVKEEGRTTISFSSKKWSA